MIDETKLQHAFQEGLNLPPETEFTELVFNRSQGWDSMAHPHLIAAIETEFGIMIDTTDVLIMNSYQKALDIVSKYT